MEEAILKSISLRPGMIGKEALLKDMISDSVIEMKNYLNYAENEDLPKECVPAVKQLVLIKYNQDGVEGIQSEGNSGVSTSYLTDLPPTVMKQIRHFRKLPR